MEKQNLYIFGASGLGRETYCLLRDLPQYRVEAFVEHDANDLREVSVADNVVKVIKESEFESLCKQNKAICAVIAIGRPHLREKIAERFGALCEFPNIIHPSVDFTGKVTLGRGNLITPHCFFSENITIGDFNFFNTFNNVGHDVVIGDCNVLLPSCIISGFVAIGNRNLLGAQTFVIEHKSIGDEIVIGAGSVVLSNIIENGTYFGAPARKIFN